MVIIRLVRTGTTNSPYYRIVVADSRFPRNGRNIETIGRFDPREEPSVITLESERLQYWLSKGAQPSESMKHIILRYGREQAAAATTAPAAKAAPKKAAKAPAKKAASAAPASS